MSKQLTALLLKRKIDNIKGVKDSRQYLINCLQKQGFIKEDIKTEPIQSIQHDTCKLCNSSSLIFSNNEKICEKCGSADININSNPFKSYKQEINFSKGTFIEPGICPERTPSLGSFVSPLNRGAPRASKTSDPDFFKFDSVISFRQDN